MSIDDKSTLVPPNSPTTPNTVCGLYGSPHEPLHPSTRSFKRQLMERTISDLLIKLDYTGMKYSEAKNQRDVLRNILAIKNEEIESLTNEVYSLKRQRNDMWDDYQDLYHRYQEKCEQIRESKK